MGGIAIWCMHFVGNRAIVIGNGEPELQIAYSPGFTALSFFLPILVLLPAFLATDSHDQVRHVRVALCGTTAGLSICGMHYLGQLGISNLICTYEAPYVIASAVVAVVASVAALTIFFLCRAAWTNSWWKRGLCSLLLAGGVSGMHWLASVGTRYRYRDSHQSTVADSLSKKQTVIVVITLVR
jgi:NO-binding membrane sensor protein with MHYT domain